jgi:folate/biopterin transporter
MLDDWIIDVLNGPIIFRRLFEKQRDVKKHLTLLRCSMMNIQEEILVSSHHEEEEEVQDDDKVAFLDKIYPQVQIPVPPPHFHHSFACQKSPSHTKKVRRTRIQQFLRWIRKLRKTFGLSFLFLLSTIYGIQGFQTFSELARNYFIKDELNLQPAESQVLTTMSSLPWAMKPLYGILSDSVSLYGYHRKSYLILCSLLSCLSYLSLSMKSVVSTPMSFLFFLTLDSISTAATDVVIDARVVEIARIDPKNGANDLQTISWIMLSFGGILGSFLSGAATQQLGNRQVFLISSIGPLLVLLNSLTMHENKRPSFEKNVKTCSDFVKIAKKQFYQLQIAFQTPIIHKSILWVFLSSAISPMYTQASFYFTTDVLQFTPEFQGFVKGFDYIFLLVGTVVFKVFFQKIVFRRIFLITQLLLVFVSFLEIFLVTRWNLSLGISDKMFVLGDSAIADIVFRLQGMPILVMCMKLCPKGIEGTMFALLMSIWNFASGLSEFWGAIICTTLGIDKNSFDLFWLAILIRTFLTIVPIFFLFLIPTHDLTEEMDRIELTLNDFTESSEKTNTSTTNTTNTTKVSTYFSKKETGEEIDHLCRSTSRLQEEEEEEKVQKESLHILKVEDINTNIIVV